MTQAASSPVGIGLTQVPLWNGHSMLSENLESIYPECFVPVLNSVFVVFILLWNLTLLPSWRPGRYWLKWHRCCDRKLPCASIPTDSSRVSGFIMWRVSEPCSLHLPVVLFRWPADEQSAPHPTPSLQGFEQSLGWVAVGAGTWLFSGGLALMEG